MPTYIFKDKNSEEIFEFKMKMSELDIFKKKNPKLVQLPTAPSFRLKGSGWYETDFKTGKKKNISTKDAHKNDKSKESSKSDSKKGSKQDKISN